MSKDVLLLIGMLLTLYGLLMFILVILRIVEERKLTVLLTTYKELMNNQDCYNAVHRSAFVLSLIVEYGEFLFIPLKKTYVMNKNNSMYVYRLRYSNNRAVQRAVSATQSSNYLMLDHIVRKNIKAYANFASSWGLIKDGKSSTAGSINDLTRYNKAMYLYSSLISAGIILDKGRITRDAFMLMLWDTAHKIMEDHVHECEKKISDAIIRIKADISNPQFASYANILQNVNPGTDYVGNEMAARILYEIEDMKPDEIKQYLANGVYLVEGRILWYNAFKSVQGIVDSVVEKYNQQIYIRNLLNNSSVSMINIYMTDSMDPISFENLIARMFSRMGYMTTTTKASGDQGIDVIAKKKGHCIAIQAKCYSGSVGNSAIQEAVAGKAFYNADEAYVVTNSTFTKSAIKLAKANNVTLWDRAILANKLDELCIPLSSQMENGSAPLNATNEKKPFGPRPMFWE